MNTFDFKKSAVYAVVAIIVIMMVTSFFRTPSVSELNANEVRKLKDILPEIQTELESKTSQLSTLTTEVATLTDKKATVTKCISDLEADTSKAFECHFNKEPATVPTASAESVAPTSLNATGSTVPVP